MLPRPRLSVLTVFLLGLLCGSSSALDLSSLEQEVRKLELQQVRVWVSENPALERLLPAELELEKLHSKMLVEAALEWRSSEAKRFFASAASSLETEAPLFKTIAKASSQGFRGVEIQAGLLNLRPSENPLSVSLKVTRDYAPPKAPILRESVALQFPFEPLATFRSFAFLVEGEELLGSTWEYSPVSSKVRQIPFSLRNEPLRGLSLSAPVIFESSEHEKNKELLENSEEFVALAPLDLGADIETSQQAACLNIERKLPFADDRAELSSALSPSERLLRERFVFVPRVLKKVEFRFQNPFVSSRLVVLYLDAEQMLPVYRFDFGGRGSLLRQIVYSWLPIRFAEGAKHFLPSAMLSFSPSAGEDLLRVEHLKYCKDFGESAALTFDPAAFLQAKTEQEEQEKASQEETPTT